MPTLFVDSSALVKRYQDEDGSARVADLVHGAEELIIARLTIVEVSSALVRRARATRQPAVDLTNTLADLDRDVDESFKVLELDASTMTSAGELARRHGVRGADAIQLACLLLARRDHSSNELILLSADDELNAAAVAEGLQVENPNLRP